MREGISLKIRYHSSSTDLQYYTELYRTIVIFSHWLDGWGSD